MQNKGILYIMSGPSGTGKGTICEELLKRRKDIHLSVSMTSREQRNGELVGVTYNYVSEDEFKNKIDNDLMLEWAVYNGKYYGTPKEKIEEMLNSGCDVLLEIEAQGALQVKSKMPEAIMMFIIPPSMKALRERLENRGREKQEEIEQRISAARWEFSQSFKYNNIIVNDNLEACVDEILGLMDTYKRKRNQVENLLNE